MTAANTSKQFLLTAKHGSVIIIVLYMHEKTEILLRHGLYNNSLYHSLRQKKTAPFRQCPIVM